MLRKLLIGVAALAATSTGALAADLSNMTWDEIIAQAKKEGEVTWAVWYLKDEFRGAVKGFENKYGIKVRIPDGNVGANVKKLIADKDRETGDFDVFAHNFTLFTDFDTQKMFYQLDMLPKDDGRVTELTGSVSDGTHVAYWGNQTGISYDPKKVSEAELPNTPEEFEAFWAKHPNKFGFNYVKGGSGPSFYINTIAAVTGVDLQNGDDSPERLEQIKPGLDFFNRSAENYVITASNSDSITRVSDGELWMAPGWEDHVAGLQKRGEVRKDIKFYVPSMGMFGGGNGIAIPKNARHPAAAALLVDWLSSAETQTMFNVEFGTAPMHADADGSNALVAADQRAHSRPWAQRPFRTKIEEIFIENVVQER